MKTLLLLLLLLAPTLKAQTPVVRPNIPTDSLPHIWLRDTARVNRFPPPEIYARWWVEIQQCTGFKASHATFEKIEFWWVADRYFYVEDLSFRVVGYTPSWNNRIYLTMPGILSEALVKHEMLHHIMWHNGISANHDPLYFKKCNVM